MGVMLAFIFSILLIFILAVSIGSIVFYVLGSIGLYKLAKNRGLNHAWIAWIPTVNNYLLGELTGNRMWGLSESKWILVLAPIVAFILNATGYGAIIGLPLTVAYSVYYFMVLYKLYKIYRPQSAVLYIVLSIIFNFMINIWLFVIRNSEPALLVEERKEEEKKVVREERPEISGTYQSVRDTLNEIVIPEKSHYTDEDLNRIHEQLDSINLELNNTFGIVSSNKTEESKEEKKTIELTLEPFKEMSEEELLKNADKFRDNNHKEDN